MRQPMPGKGRVRKVFKDEERVRRNNKTMGKGRAEAADKASHVRILRVLFSDHFCLSALNTFSQQSTKLLASLSLFLSAADGLKPNWAITTVQTHYTLLEKKKGTRTLKDVFIQKQSTLQAGSHFDLKFTFPRRVS